MGVTAVGGIGSSSNLRVQVGVLHEADERFEAAVVVGVAVEEQLELIRWCAFAHCSTKRKSSKG